MPDNVYERITGLADEAAWYREDQDLAEDQAAGLRRLVAAATSPIDWWRLRRMAAAESRRAALAGRLAEAAESERLTLLDQLSDAPEPTEPPTMQTPGELLLRYRDALAREQAAAGEANRQHTVLMTSRWPWQRHRRQVALMRMRYADACTQAHTAAAVTVRRELDHVVRSRLP